MRLQLVANGSVGTLFESTDEFPVKHFILFKIILAFLVWQRYIYIYERNDSIHVGTAMVPKAFLSSLY